MTPPRDTGSEASVRDHLANERTFLAWVRTAVTNTLLAAIVLVGAVALAAYALLAGS